MLYCRMGGHNGQGGTCIMYDSSHVDFSWNQWANFATLNSESIRIDLVSYFVTHYSKI